MAHKTIKRVTAAKPKPRRVAGGGGPPARTNRSGGNPSYAGYEYQIGVTVWAGLDLMLAKTVTEALTIEPKSDEDIEAAVIDPNKASLDLTTAGGRCELVIQAKSRSTAPWTTTDLADVLTGNEDRDGVLHPGSRARPLAMLLAEPSRRYVFVTNESLQSELRPHGGEHLLDFPEVETLPPYARKGFDEAAQASMAPRLLLCSGVTVEILESRIVGLLSRHGHVPISKHTACIRDLRDAVRLRIAGLADGRWTRADLLAVLAMHGGSVLPTRAMDHYVRPRSYEAIRSQLENHHAVLIAGPSGTGKTLTADIIEVELRQSETPFDVVGEEHGPTGVRNSLTRSDPVLFHLRDPWGGNRLLPGADRWSDELPKLLSHAGPGRKFLITSRSDVLQSAGYTLTKELAPYLISIEIEDYNSDRLGEIYDGIGSDLSSNALALAKRHRTKALNTLTRPYEIDRFLVALSREDPAKPRKIDLILSESQIDAISRVVADQIAAWGDDGVASASIIWGMLSARGAIGNDVFPKLVRRLRAIDAQLRPDLAGLIDFLVAGRNLRSDGAALAFYHPRVEDGLRMAILSRQGEAEHVLSRLADALVAFDQRGGDWGTETVLGILRAIVRLNGFEIALADSTHSRVDAYLEAAAIAAQGYNIFEPALADLARYGSPTNIPSRLARLLIKHSVDGDEVGFRHAWLPPEPSVSEIAELKADSRTQSTLERFIREVLPFSRTDYDAAIVGLIARLGSDLTGAYSDALETVVQFTGPGENIGVIVAGALHGDAPEFDRIIERLANAEASVDAWTEKEYKPEGRRAEEHEIDATSADHVMEEPEERYYNSQEGMRVAAQLRWVQEGIGWVAGHPHRELVVYALAGLIAKGQRNPSPQELRQLLGCADGWVRGHTWWGVAQNWDPSLDDLLEIELHRTDLSDKVLRKTLIKIAAGTTVAAKDPLRILMSVAGSIAVERRLELITDVMTTHLDGDPSGTAAMAARRKRAECLASRFPSPQDELGRALSAVMAQEDLRQVGIGLTGQARLLLSEILSLAPTSVAAPLVCLAAAISINPIATAERLLATDEVADGEAAVIALAIDGRPDAVATLWRAFRHGRYRVRRDALKALVEGADLNDRVGLIDAARDRGADVRLAWAELMRTHKWPEAIDSLVELLADRRDFACDRAYGPGPSWSQFRVARAAAHALGSYQALTASAVDGLIVVAVKAASPDPFVACAALAALADKDDDRILPTLLAGLASSALTGAPGYRPLAQAASWALFDRAVAEKLDIGDAGLSQAAGDASAEVAGPLLMAFGIVGGTAREDLLHRLFIRGLSKRSELIMIAAAAAKDLPVNGRSPIHDTLEKLAAGKSLSSLDLNERQKVEAWSLSLDATADVQRYSVWLASEVFHLPVRERVTNPRAFNLPERIGVMTMRSLTPASEEFDDVDDGN